jgi:arsenate reductase
MYPKIELIISKLLLSFDSIPSPRKQKLIELAAQLKLAFSSANALNLVFVCTHNSRRSHMGQLWAKLAAHYYGFENVNSFSAGTEVTELNSNVIEMLQKVGYKVSTFQNVSNPAYLIEFGENQSLTCFSKLIEHKSNPKADFFAIMMCTEAEANCPFVPGAIHRIGLPFDDPKVYDNTIKVSDAYLSTFEEIGLQILFLFNQIKHDNY